MPLETRQDDRPFEMKIPLLPLFGHWDQIKSYSSAQNILC